MLDDPYSFLNTRHPQISHIPQFPEPAPHMQSGLCAASAENPGQFDMWLILEYRLLPFPPKKYAEVRKYIDSIIKGGIDMSYDPNTEKAVPADREAEKIELQRLIAQR